jgi:hypothetical protein
MLMYSAMAASCATAGSLQRSARAGTPPRLGGALADNDLESLHTAISLARRRTEPAPPRVHREATLRR